MKRVIIIGCGGAGKSTLARALGEKTGIPVVHLDKLCWRPGWVMVDSSEFDRQVRAEMEKERWILDGNFGRTLPERLQHCDTVIFLDFNRFTCLFSWLRRVITYWGRTRPDMTEGCSEWFDPEFIKWIWNYNRDKRPKIRSALESAGHANVLVLKNRRQVRAFMAELI